MTRRVSIGFVALGIALRLLQYGIPRSLWFDEARNAAEILKPDWLLMLPPHSAQPTPLGFLLLERAVVAILGEGELALRLLPLLAGIAALLVAARLAHQTLSGWMAPLAVALLALSGPAIYFSTEVKQYSSDLLVGLLIALAFAKMDSRSEPGAQGRVTQVALFGLIGAAGLWVSYTSVFILAVAGTMLVTRTLRARDRRTPALYLGMGALWLASFALHYQLAISHWSETRWLTAFWAAGFPRGGEGFAAVVNWSLSSLIAAFENPLGVTIASPIAAGFAALFFAVGVVGAARSRNTPAGRVLNLLTGVFALAFASALLHLYPFKGRLLLFLVPSMAFLVAHGVGVVVSAARSRGAALPGPIDPIITGVAVAIAGALLAGGAWSALRLATLEPFHRHGTVNLARMKGVEKGFEGISEVVGYVARNHQRGDLVYLYYSAEPGYLYYARQLGFRAPTITGVRSQGDFRPYAADLDALRGNARVWVVFSHTVPAERDFSVRHLESVGARLDYYRRPRADAYLFDLR